MAMFRYAVAYNSWQFFVCSLSILYCFIPVTIERVGSPPSAAAPSSGAMGLMNNYTLQYLLMAFL